MEDRLDSIDYLDEQVLYIRVEQEEDGYYSINNEDFQHIDDLIIAYY